MDRIVHPRMIYHIAESRDWHPRSAYSAPSLEQEGFIHASSWLQLPRIARSLFAGRTDVVVLEIDSELLDAPPVWEDLYDLFEEFPHVYGEIGYQAVIATLDLSWNANAPLFRLSGLDHDSEELRLEPIDPSDSGAVSDLARLNGQLIEDEKHDRWLTSSELEERMARFLSGRYTGYMLRIGDTCCGYALIDHERDPVYLRHYFVRRGLRRAGIGSDGVNLIQTMIAGEIEIECLLQNRRGIRFWHKMGFADRAVSMRLPTRPCTPITRTATPETEVIVEDAEHAAAFLKEQIQSFNDQASPHHRSARNDGAVQHVAVMLSEGDRWRGGVSGSLFWDWLSVDDFWIDEPLRRSGHGNRLLRQIEEIARSRGAKRAKLSTFDFQARGFYEHHGYQVVGTLDGYPPGGSFFWMAKEL